LLLQEPAPNEESGNDGLRDFHAQLEQDVDHKGKQDFLGDREIREEIDDHTIDQGKGKNEQGVRDFHLDLLFGKQKAAVNPLGFPKKSTAAIASSIYI
jgi:hypothetical protein